MARILVDVDQTVVDTLSEWARWLEFKTKTRKPIHTFQEVEYNVASYWEKECEAMGIDGLDFWRQPDVYDNLKPLPKSVETLRYLNNVCGHEIVFVSQLKGNHHKSKYYFLQKYFPFMTGFVGTKEKWLVYGDVLIDDRNNHLNSMPDHFGLVKIETRCTQYEDENKPMLHFDWEKDHYTVLENYINRNVEAKIWPV